MTLRVVQPTFTFEQQRQEINLLASDVGDVDLTLTPSNTVVASINDIIVGNVTLSGQTIGFEDGHSTAPSFYFDSNQKLGFYRYDVSTVGITNNLFVASGLTVGGDFILAGTLDLGNDLNVRGDVTISGTLYNLGDVTLDSKLSVTDNTLLKSDLDVQGSTTVSGTLYNEGNVNFASTLLVQGNTTISGTLYNEGNVNFASTLLVQGNTTISGTLYNEGNATLASNLHVQGNTTISGTVVIGDETTFRDNLFLGDDNKINLGYSNDLQIYHDGSNSYITDTGIGDLILRGSADIKFENPTGSEVYAIFNVDNSVELYFNNSKKFQTTNLGANVLGALDVDGDINIDGGDVTVSTTTFNLANDVATTVNAFNSATLLTFGATTGTTTVRNNLDIQGNTTISGILYVEGDVTFKSGSSGSITIGDQNTDNVAFGADINSGLIPNTDDNYDLGSLEQQWKNLYIDGIAYIDTLSIDENATITGDLAVNGGDITTTASAFNLLDSNATTVNAFGASTTLNLGATTGTTTVRNNLDIQGNTTISGTLLANGNTTLNDLIITGNLTVNGTTTTLNTETVTADDPNLTLGDIRNQLDESMATDFTALGGGLTLKGDTDKIISWSGDTWNSTESFSVESGRTYQIDNQVVLSYDTLGSSVINSSLINVGDLVDLTVLGNTNLVTSSGNVSIGGVPATAKLDVGGDVRIRGDLYDVTNDQGEPGDFLTPTASGIQWRSLDVANLLFVSKDGNDNNDGLSLFKAKATIKSALEVAESIILPQDPGTRSDAAILIDANKEFIQKETYGYITEKYPNLLNIGSLPSGANRYQDASNLILANKDEIADRALAEIAVQYDETLWGTDWIIPGDSDPGRGRYFDSYRLIQNNRSEIINTAWSNLILAYPGSSTTETKCKRDIGYFVDYVSLDLFLGSNKYARKFILQYFCNGAPSEDGLVGEEAQSIYAFNQVRDLMKLAITNQLTYVDNTITDSNDDGNAAYTSGDCVDVQATIDTLTAIITTPISEGGTESLPEENVGSLQSGSSKCLRDIGYIIDAVASDLAVGGNIRSIEAAESYANGTSSPVDGEELQTVAAFTKAGDMMKLAINNQLIERDYTLIPDPLTGSNTDTNSCADVQNNIDTLISLVNSVVTSGDIATISGVTRNDGVWFMRDITKCQRDIGYIVDAFVEDLRDGGNVNSVDAGNYYYDANGLDYINGQIDESIEAFEYVRDLSIAAMRNWDFYVPSAEIVNGSSIVTVPSTLGIVVGMEVTSTSFGIPANSYVNQIISSNQFVLGTQDRTNTVNALATTSLTLDFQLEGGAWASGVTPATKSGITLDISYPECANVTTAIVTYANIIRNILENGKDSVPKAWPGAGIKVEVKTGTYTEQNPLRVPTNVSVHGDDLRSVNVIPANPTEDIFHVYNGSYITGMTFQGHVAPSSAVAFPPTGAGLITKSPYIQNCTSITTTGCGMRVDGDRASGTKSMVLDSYTQYNQGGDGIVIINGGYAQLVSIFEICCDRAVYVGSGGTCSITNSNTDFGNFGLIADGTGPLQYTASIDGNGQTGGVFNLRNIGNNKPYVGQVCTIGGLFYTIQTINLTNGGSGYTSVPNVTIDLPTGPGAFPAQATATVENGKVTAVTLLVSGNQFEVCPRITIDAPTSGITATAEAEMYPSYYTINSSTKPVNGECTITLEENLPYTPNDGDEVRFYQVSRIIASAHCFEYVGSGTNINTALPAKGGVPIQDQEAVKLNGGRIAITSTDHLGNFRIGSDLVINQNTGTLSGRTFSRSLFAELTPFILALQ